MKEIKLQGIYEKKQGKEVKDLKKGDVITWNYGYQSEVVEMIKSKTGKTFTVMLKSLQDGIVRERKMKATSLVVA
jgi:translation elongation factor P/translation initiation factor 5A|nr:MAG TPA: Elongation factor P (EF-P) KOW-like domain [Caudoviricetes sp.]